MVILLTGVAMSLLLQTGLEVGEHWSVDRSYRRLEETLPLDVTTWERVEYRVDASDRSGLKVMTTRKTFEREPQGKDLARPKSESGPTLSVRLGRGGAPVLSAEGEDPIRDRVERMQWTAAEDRRGVSWSRRFPALPGLPAAKVTVRPKGERTGLQTVEVEYTEEGTPFRGVGTAEISLPKRIVTSFKLTFNQVTVDNLPKPIKIAINQSLTPPNP